MSAPRPGTTRAHTHARPPAPVHTHTYTHNPPRRRTTMIRSGKGLRTQTGSGRALRTGGSQSSCSVAANTVAAFWCKLDGLAKWREMAMLRQARYLSPPCRSRSLRLSPSPSNFSRNPHSTTSRPRDRKGRAGEGQSNRERGKGRGEERVESREKGQRRPQMTHPSGTERTHSGGVLCQRRAE